MAPFVWVPKKPLFFGQMVPEPIKYENLIKDIPSFKQNHFENPSNQIPNGANDM